MDPVVIAVLVIAIAALGVALWSYKNRAAPIADATPRGGTQRPLESACREALAAVDLLTPAGGGTVELSPTTHSSVGERLRFISERLVEVDRTAISEGVSDAVDDLRHVSISLSAALDADQSLRRSGDDPTAAAQTSSRHRISARTAELDLAARSLIGLTSASG